ncbi:NAD(P)H-hydrate dehydratase, partial [Ruthenibacterium lactatiformans]|nr:NAD(P)H-hydrate dehydratase [Ruthenibacterium lactatiformans]
MPAVITNEMVFAALPPRPPESHKGAYGRVLAVCGCPAYRGAAALSVLGA